MGMFDTFHFKNQGRQFAVQSKEFACILNDYRLGDFVEYETDAAPRCVLTYIGDHKQDWSDAACDWAIAGLWMALPEYRESVPAGYGVGAGLEVANPGERNHE